MICGNGHPILLSSQGNLIVRSWENKAKQSVRHGREGDAYLNCNANTSHYKLHIGYKLRFGNDMR